MEHTPQIKKGVPIPLDLTEGRPIKGGHQPAYPFRDMEKHDYIEIEIISSHQRQAALTALRNARKSRPKWVFAWKYGYSADENLQGNGKAYIKIWRTK